VSRRRTTRASELAIALSAPEHRERVAKLAALGASAQGPAITAAVRDVARETGFTQRDVRAVLRQTALVAALDAHARRDAHLAREKTAAAVARERFAENALYATGRGGMAHAVFAGQPVVTPGQERVATCKFCGALSTADLRGLTGWGVHHGGDVCPECMPHRDTVDHAVRRIVREAREAIPDLLDVRPESAEQLHAADWKEAVALRNCLRGLKIRADVGCTPETGTWFHVWVYGRDLPRARLVRDGFSAGVSLR
jgi:hypothetical protein